MSPQAPGADKPRIHIVATGGTISSAATSNSALAPSHGGDDLVRAVPGLAEGFAVEVEEYSRVLSSQLSVQQLWELGTYIRQTLAERADLAGIVVTHGTGTMEESAFLADLLHTDRRPVVFTGAMRAFSDPFSDAASNLLNAVRVAAAPSAAERGVLVALNERIHAARDAYKSHTWAVDTFKSANTGPIGYVYPDRIHFMTHSELRTTLATTRPEFNVDLIKFVVGMDDRFVRASVAAGAKGLVIEGSGLGNVNDALADGIREALARGVVVVLASRCPEGRAFPAYGTPAGAASLVERGCLISALSGPKSRILLMLALNLVSDRDELGALLDPGSAE